MLARQWFASYKQKDFFLADKIDFWGWHIGKIYLYLDGQIFSVKDRRVGVNMHPMHPWCRSSTEPVLSSDTRAMEKRWARDPVTGEEMKVSADMTYREWEKKIAEMNGNRAGKQSSVEQKMSHKALTKQTDNGKMNVGGCKDYGELKHYLDTQHGIQLDSSMKNLHFSSVKSAFEGIEHAINDVPELANIIKGASASQNTDFMACTYNGFLHFNESLYKNPQTLKKVFKENIALGYWIKGSSPASVGVQEASHLVERMLIDKSGKYQSHFEKNRSMEQVY